MEETFSTGTCNFHSLTFVEGHPIFILGQMAGVGGICPTIKRVPWSNFV